MAFLAPLLGAGGAAGAGAAGAGAAGAASAAGAGAGLGAAGAGLGASTALPAIAMPAALAPTTSAGIAAAAPSIAAPASALSGTAPVLGTGAGYSGAGLGVNTSLASTPGQSNLLSQLQQQGQDQKQSAPTPLQQFAPIMQGPSAPSALMGNQNTQSLLDYINQFSGTRR